MERPGAKRVTLRTLHAFMVFLHSSVVQRSPSNRYGCAGLVLGFQVLIRDRRPQRIRCAGIRGSCASDAHKVSQVFWESDWRMPAEPRSEEEKKPESSRKFSPIGLFVTTPAYGGSIFQSSPGSVVLLWYPVVILPAAAEVPSARQGRFQQGF